MDFHTFNISGQGIEPLLLPCLPFFPKIVCDFCLLQSDGWFNVWVSSNWTSWEETVTFVSCSLPDDLSTPHCICRHSHAPRSFTNWRQHGADNWKYFDHLDLGLNLYVPSYSALGISFVITFVTDFCTHTPTPSLEGPKDDPGKNCPIWAKNAVFVNKVVKPDRFKIFFWKKKITIWRWGGAHSPLYRKLLAQNFL